MKVGDTIWLFDVNNRVYLNNNSSPDYRSFWVPVKIMGETTKSWLSCGKKIPKAGDHPGFAFTQQEVDDKVWVNDYKYAIMEGVQRTNDANKLRAVAEIIKYK